MCQIQNSIDMDYLKQHQRKEPYYAKRKEYPTNFTNNPNKNKVIDMDLV